MNKAIRNLLFIIGLFCLDPRSAIAADTIIEWTGGCYNTQVYSFGNVTLIKTPNEDSYDVTMIGYLSIYSPTEYHMRQELPPGFTPNTADLDLYTCQEAINGGEQRTVSVAQGAYDLDLLYENGSIWFPVEKFNGRYDLTCRWKTDQPDPEPGVWESCAAITKVDVIQPTATPTFIPTAPANPAPIATPTFSPTAPPNDSLFYKIYLPNLNSVLCLPGSCN